MGILWMVVAAMAVAMAAAARVATATVWLAEGSWVAASATACAAAHIPPACWLWLGLGRVGVRDRVGRMCGKERCVVARGGLRHAQACGYKMHAGAGVGDVGITRVWGRPADSMSAFCLVEGRRGGSRRKGAGKGPRPRPATTPVKAHVQLRFDAQRARLVMTRGRVRDMIVKDRADTVRLAHAKV